ncbi:sulfatase-like hydrolase/transferase [Pseudonocardia alni]|uniref:sulfatase-like hydrolase/transferase n=1 Tax=Pseudonocardia alni TaxID=33907 RepID=UPI0033CA7455
MTNVLVVMTDQQTAASTLPGSHGRASTPHLDRFARDAVTFSRAYSTAPHSCPARASFFTGLYPSEHGVWNNVAVTNALSRGTRPGTPFWSDELGAAGHDLAFAGRWVVSNHESPADRGWRELIVFPPMPGLPDDEEKARRTARDRDAARLPAHRDREPGEIVRPGFPRYRHYGVDEDPYEDAAVVERACGFLADRAGDPTPWVLYVGTFGPHEPYTPPQRFLDLYDPDEIVLPPSFDDPMDDKPALYRRTRDRFDQLTEAEHRETLRHYLAFCSYQDELFGRLLAALEASGAAQDTVVVFTSDHGEQAGDHGLWLKGLAAFLSAYHVPLVIGGPGVTRRGTVDATVSLIDVGPTLLELCGAGPGRAVSGRSLGPVLRGETDRFRDDLFLQCNGNEAYGIQRILVHEGWKLVMNLFDYDELYDLGADPHEMHNLLAPARPAGRRVGRAPLAEVPPELRDRLRGLYARLWRLCLDHDDDVLNHYVLTALSPFGPGVAFDRQEQT